MAVAFMLLLATVSNCVAGGEAEAVPEGEALLDCTATAGDAEGVGEGDAVAESETAPVRVPDPEGESNVAAGNPDGATDDADKLALPVLLGDAPVVRLAVCDCVCVLLALTVALGDCVGVALEL